MAGDELQVSPEQETAPLEPVAAEEGTRLDTTPKAARALDGGRNLKLAIATGLTLGALALGLLSLGAGPFFVLVFGMILLAQGEFYLATRKAGYDPATALGLAAGGVLLLGSFLRGEAAAALVLFLTLLFSFVWYLGSPPASPAGGRSRGSLLANLGITFLGVAYIPLLGSFVALMLRLPPASDGTDGRGVVLVALGAAAFYDIFAYAGGSRWGKRKLAPHISPSKTVEGALIATVGITIMAAVLAPVFGPWNPLEGAVLGLMAAVAAPLGDLFESMIKRDLGLKDMGGVFPGHGGALDRFDAILFTAPVTYLSLRLFGLYIAA